MDISESIESIPFAPPLGGDVYAEYYQLRKQASTMTDVTIQWFQQNIPLLFNNIIANTDRPSFSILSIGCGEGDIDMAIIQALLPRLNAQQKQLHYHVIEPNPIHIEHFLTLFNRFDFDNRVQVTVHKGYFGIDDDEVQQQNYDLILPRSSVKPLPSGGGYKRSV
jgi:hypothetical protein